MSLIAPLDEPSKDPWCLAFANTVSSRNASDRRDRLQTYQDLRAWLEKREILSTDASSIEDPKTLERAKRLREAIYGIASALSAGRDAEPQDVDELHWHVQRAIVAVQLRSNRERLAWDLHALKQSVSGGLGLIALSAAGLFTSDLATRVRECRKPECGWLFVDVSKNRSRKWCDMADCGNLEKARRYYAKSKAAQKA